MDIDDSSYSRSTARAGQPGADQDMTEVAEILLKMNVNSARQRRYSWSTQVTTETSAPNTSGCRDLFAGSHAVASI